MTLCYLLLGLLSTALGQASLAAEDQIDEVQVNIDGVKESFTVIRDALQRNQFYYMPTGPRVFERDVNGKREPEFSLVRYQFSDPTNPAQLLEGGVLQFSATMSCPPGAIDQMKARIKTAFANVGEVRLAAMPLKKADVHLLVPTNNSLVVSKQGEGIAPVIATQKMAFLLELSDKGTDVYDALIKSPTGVGMTVGFTYLGLTPKAGFKVTVDWNQTYKHYSNDHKFAARASYYGLVSASANVQKSKIADTLLENKCIEIEGRTGEGFGQQELDNYLQPILKRINDEILAKMVPPATIPPAAATQPSADGFFGGAGYSVAIKNASQVKSGKETFRFDIQQIVERTTIASGFCGIGKYVGDQELMNRLVLVAAPGFKSAYFILPPVGDATGLQQVDLEVNVVHKDHSYVTQTAVWKPGPTGWTFKDKPVSVMPIALTGLPAELQGKPLSDLVFKTETKMLLSSGQYFVTKGTSPVFNGSKSAAPPSSTVDVVEISGAALPWRMINPAVDKLVAATVKLTSGGKTHSGTLQAKVVNGQYSAPDPLRIFLARPDGADVTPFDATVDYTFIGRPPVRQTLQIPRATDGVSVFWLDPTTWPSDTAPATGPTSRLPD